MYSEKFNLNTPADFGQLSQHIPGLTDRCQASASHRPSGHTSYHGDGHPYASLRAHPTQVFARSQQEASTTLLRTLPEYDEGLAAYRARRWMTAIDHFQKLLDIAADRPARAMIAHCRHFIKKDVGSYWNTSWADFESED